MFKWHVFPFSKKKYIKGDRPKVDCILCAYQNNDPSVTTLEVVSSNHFIVAINLYPYNSGHLMVFPKRHLSDVREFSAEEDREMALLTRILMDVMDKVYQPTGYNVGYNIGSSSGASIQHIHLHIVPRYRNELGMVDIIGGAKVIIEDPNETCEKMARGIQEYCQSNPQLEINLVSPGQRNKDNS